MCKVEHELQRLDQGHIFHRIQLLDLLLLRNILLRVSANVQTYILSQVILIDQLLDIDVRIVGGKEDYPRDQKFVVPVIVLQFITCFLLISDIHKYLPRIRPEEEGVRKTSERTL